MIPLILAPGHARRSLASSMLVLWCVIAALLVRPAAASYRNVTYVKGYSGSGVEMLFRADRTPALYTGDFGDCLASGSQFQIDKFDAALYYDNMTVLFHLDGTTNLVQDNVMMRIFVYAYGESRFSLTFDPCVYSIYSLCPASSSRNITAWGAISLSTDELAFIPDIALTIPDFEGYARLYVYSNTTKEVVGCFQAAMRNSYSFYQPRFVVPFIAIFSGIAIIASFLAAIYGFSVPHMRMHSAHAVSALVIFEMFQSMFLFSAVAIPWPGVLTSWWANFSWAAGMLPVSGVVSAVSHWAGVRGDPNYIGQVPTAPQPDDGDAAIVQQIYSRALDFAAEHVDRTLAQVSQKVAHVSRALVRTKFNPDNPWDYKWNGWPMMPGMPMPGTMFGFGGGLTPLQIPSANAFTVGLVWFLVFLLVTVASVVLLKLAFDLLCLTRWRRNSFNYFRSHIWGFCAAAAARYGLLAGFSLLTLATYQLSISSPAGPKAIAAICFILVTCAMAGAAAYAIYVRAHDGTFLTTPDPIRIQKKRIIRGHVPFIEFVRASKLSEEEISANEKPIASIPFIRLVFTPSNPDAPRVEAHDDEAYIKHFGWLSAKYRRSRWWFFGVWVFYQLLKAIIVGGGSATPQAQLACLFVLEVLFFITTIIVDPFEGTRNTALAVWMMGISKVATCALSFPLLESVGLDRIFATAIGIIIIVVQGLVVIAIFILVVLGGISTWMSLRRNSENFPASMENRRVDYYTKMEKRARDQPPERKPQSSPKKNTDVLDDENNKVMQAEAPPGFKVARVRRLTKTHEDEPDFPMMASTLPSLPSTTTGTSIDTMHHDIAESLNTSSPALPTEITQFPAVVSTRQSRSNSLSSLPRAARSHRGSWSSRDFMADGHGAIAAAAATAERPDSALAQQVRAAAAQRIAAQRAQQGQTLLEPMVEVDAASTYRGSVDGREDQNEHMEGTQEIREDHAKALEENAKPQAEAAKEEQDTASSTCRHTEEEEQTETEPKPSEGEDKEKTEKTKTTEK